jgi:hypothetical protein
VLWVSASVDPALRVRVLVHEWGCGMGWDV